MLAFVRCDIKYDNYVPSKGTGEINPTQKYLVIAQPDKIPVDGYNMVIQDQNNGNLHLVYSIDFDFE